MVNSNLAGHVFWPHSEMLEAQQRRRLFLSSLFILFGVAPVVIGTFHVEVQQCGANFRVLGVGKGFTAVVDRGFGRTLGFFIKSWKQGK